MIGNWMALLLPTLQPSLPHLLLSTLLATLTVVNPPALLTTLTTLTVVCPPYHTYCCQPYSPSCLLSCCQPSLPHLLLSTPSPPCHTYYCQPPNPPYHTYSCQPSLPNLLLPPLQLSLLCSVMSLLQPFLGLMLSPSVVTFMA